MADQQPNLPPMGAPPPMNQGGAPDVPSAPPPNMNAPSFPQNPMMQGGQDSESSIEEIEQVVETIIDERWQEVTESIKKVLDWKNSMDEKMSKMEDSVKTLKEDFNELYRAIVGKVGEYDKNILKVDTELKALEKVFSQVLPTFTANVNELSRIAEDFKGTGKLPSDEQKESKNDTDYPEKEHSHKKSTESKKH